MSKNKEHYDVVIIGAGIVGIGCFRDLALHGLKTLIIDKGDFSSQTSKSSSKMLHGGIRYLQNFDLSLIKEALAEKNLWLKLTPHLCYERSFCLPVYKETKYPLWMLRIGFHIYDYLSNYQNTPFQVLNRQQTLKAIPGIKEDGLSGSVIYYDAIVDDLKLGLECLFDGLEEKNATAMSYIEVIGFKNDGHVVTLTLENKLDNEVFEVTCNECIFATGPFTDQVMKDLKINHWGNKILPSKGIHIWIDKSKLPLDEAVVLETKDKRIIFVIPQYMGILVGTTETLLKEKEEIFNIEANEEEIFYLLRNLKEYFPGYEIKSNDVLSSFAGVRPLVTDNGSDLGKTSRNHKIYYPFCNTTVVIGGKYTTFRIMAKDVVEPLINKYAPPYNESLACKPLRRQMTVPPFQSFSLDDKSIQDIIHSEQVKTFDDFINRRVGIPTRAHWPEEISNSDNYDVLKSKFDQFQKR